MKKKDKLEPCPFCGGEAEVLWNFKNFDFKIICENEFTCRAEMSGFLFKGKAIETWNRRTKCQR